MAVDVGGALVISSVGDTVAGRVDEAGAHAVSAATAMTIETVRLIIGLPCPAGR